MRVLMLRVALILLLFGFAAAPARADLDHKCLINCGQRGLATPICMKQCAYDEHLPPGVGTSDGPSLDYRCVRQCQSNGLSYDYCRWSCITPPTTSDAQLDYHCMSDCDNTGQKDEICRDRCTILSPDNPLNKMTVLPP